MGLDPVLAAIIQKLPPTGPWPADQRATWLAVMALGLEMIYGEENRRPEPPGAVGAPDSGDEPKYSTT